jgi:hypothetical protein
MKRKQSNAKRRPVKADQLNIDDVQAIRELAAEQLAWLQRMVSKYGPPRVREHRRPSRPESRGESVAKSKSYYLEPTRPRKSGMAAH